MCGIVGYWGQSQPSIQTVEAMALAIKHRGPDDAGSWVNTDNGVAFGHRRLSIIDLSPAGHQPMTSPCGHYTLVYNGEIYNHLELREQLEKEGAGFDWRGHSDTETLLAALRHWGIQGALERLNGMFAFAFWDSKNRSMFLARDRMGEKPLYYGRMNGTFLFASELKALFPHPDWQGDIDRKALDLFTRYHNVPAPHCIYKNMKKLPPAHYLVVNDQGEGIPHPVPYWNYNDFAIGEKSNHDRKELTDQLDVLLRDSVKMRMMSDVPLGVFLSGGIDSSLIAALMQQHSDKPVKTFTIGFNESGFDEAVYARKVSQHIGSDHTELYVGPEQVLDVIPNLPTIWDEPFSDSSQVPTFLVNQLASQHVKVSLSGDGGDELFRGYSRYFQVPQLWTYLRHLPLPLRKIAGKLLHQSPYMLLHFLKVVGQKDLPIARMADQYSKLGEIMSRSISEKWLYELFRSNWKRRVVLAGPDGFDDLELQTEEIWKAADSSLSNIDWMTTLDAKTYLPDDILTKVDRASMAVSLEVRAPLLDHNIAEFAGNLPLLMKSTTGRGKGIFSDVLHRYVPAEFFDREKGGFTMPVDHWLRGPLREWAEELLDERRLREEGNFDAKPIRKMWDEHLRFGRKWDNCLWSILMFQQWREHNSNLG